MGNRLYKSAKVEKSNKLTKLSGDNGFFPPFESPKGRIQIVMDVNNYKRRW